MVCFVKPNRRPHRDRLFVPEAARRPGSGRCPYANEAGIAAGLTLACAVFRVTGVALPQRKRLAAVMHVRAPRVHSAPGVLPHRDARRIGPGVSEASFEAPYHFRRSIRAAPIGTAANGEASSGKPRRRAVPSGGRFGFEKLPRARLAVPKLVQGLNKPTFHTGEPAGQPCLSPSSAALRSAEAELRNAFRRPP